MRRPESLATCNQNGSSAWTDNSKIIKTQRSDDPQRAALGKSGKENLVFNRKKPPI